MTHSAIEILEQGEMLLCALSDEAYTRKHSAVFNASIGGHYRHCLDHFRSLLDSIERSSVNYDRRERGTVIEFDRFAALNATRELRDALLRFDVNSLDAPTDVTAKTSYAGDDSQTARSSIGRELMYIVHHAVHHYALIGIMGGMMGLAMPAGFGVAPSTLRHLDRTRAGAH